jgi:hypothetical protein
MLNEPMSGSLEHFDEWQGVSASKVSIQSRVLELRETTASQDHALNSAIACEDLVVEARALEEDVQHMALTMATTYKLVGAALTWQLMREIEEEAFCDISLLGRWPLERLLRISGRDPIPAGDGVVSTVDAQMLVGLPAFIGKVFLEH